MISGSRFLRSVFFIYLVYLILGLIEYKLFAEYVIKDNDNYLNYNPHKSMIPVGECYQEKSDTIVHSQSTDSSDKE